MTRCEWIAIAESLRALRSSVVRSFSANDPDAGAAHDRKLIYFAQLEAVDRAALEVAAVIKLHACRFEHQRFLRIVGVATPIVTRD
jgi:hypothetical protein